MVLMEMMGAGQRVLEGRDALSVSKELCASF